MIEVTWDHFCVLEMFTLTLRADKWLTGGAGLFIQEIIRTQTLALGSVYTIPDSLCADTKTISDRASVHKGIADFGAVFTTERRCAASILKVNRHVSDLGRFCSHYAEVFFMSARKAIRYSVDIA